MNNRTMILTACAIFVFTIAFYFSSLKLDFSYGDDYMRIQSSMMAPARYFLADWTGLKGQGGLYRPLVVVSIAVDRMLWGVNPSGYHFSNLVFHAANAVLIFLIASALVKNYLFAAMASLLFLILPMNTEVVNWISCRCDSLAALFYLIAFYSYIRYKDSRRTAVFLMSIAAFALSLLSKESALSFPLMILAYEYFLGDLKDSSKYWISYFLMLVPYFLIRYVSLGTVLGGYPIPARDMAVNVFIGPFKTFQLVFLPFIQENLLLYFILMAVIIPCSILAVIYYSVKARPDRFFYFALSWILMALLPAIHLLSTGFDFRGSRFWYLSSIGIAWLMAYPVFAGSSKYKVNGKIIVYSLFACFFFYSAANTIQLNRGWTMASIMTRHIRAEAVKAAGNLPEGIRACFYNVPDNYKGFMVGMPYLEPPFYPKNITGSAPAGKSRYFVYDSGSGTFKSSSYYLIKNNKVPLLYDEMPNSRRFKEFLKK